jgi:hypothetical protein
MPGAMFPSPPALSRASFARRVEFQREAERKFAAELTKRLDLDRFKLGSQVTRGGWKGSVNPSTQIIFDEGAPRDAMRCYAAALGLIWNQDAVAVFGMHPDGKCLAVRLSRREGRPFTGKQMNEFYRRLYRSDDAKQATIGFTEHDGTMLFINLPGGMSDK